MFRQSSQSGLFQAASHANPPVSQESDEARQMTAGSGRRLLPLLRGLGPCGYCLKTLLVSCLSTTEWSSSVSVLRWKPKATKFNRLLFQLAASGHRIDGIESGLWPTPNRTDATLNRTPEEHFARQAKLKAGNPNLGELQMPLVTAVLMRMWPTPRANKLHGKDREDFSPSLHNMVNGELNPTWVEWLMGYPLEWTDLEDSETQSSLKSPINLSSE